MKKILVLMLALFLVGCSPKLEGYEDKYFDVFDTITSLKIYAPNEKKGKEYLEYAHNRFIELHKSFDKYNSYEGVNNVKTINDNRGVAPVKVDKDLFNLIKISVDYYNNISKGNNIAMGNLIDLWNSYRDEYETQYQIIAGDVLPTREQEDIAKEVVIKKFGQALPSDEEIGNILKDVNMDAIELNEKEQTVFIKDPNMTIDVGAIAKGYATEIVARELMDKGVKAGILSPGANVRVIGEPPEEEKETFLVGIQNPMAINDPSLDNIVAVLGVNNTSVVTSGDYQRYFTVDGKNYCHIVNPSTGKQEYFYRSVTVVAEDSGYCDFLSTALFVTPYEKAIKLVEDLDGVEAFFIMEDGSFRASSGMEKILKD